MGAQVGFDGGVREVAGGENVRDIGAVEGGGMARFGEVDVGEAAVLAGEFCERVEGFDDPGALGPAGADAGGIGEDGALAAGERGGAGLTVGARGRALRGAGGRSIARERAPAVGGG